MGVLISVNVGLPRDVEWQGKTVRTGIWKAPVAGRVRARRLNLDGDGQADLIGHGGEQRAVMIYQLDSYHYWQTILGRQDLAPGDFGENLTVDGLPDSETCIGDRFRIGSALFEVTQPRVTCYRIGIRIKNPQMPALLVAHHRPGFYCRVLEEGEIGAGDAIEEIAEGPGRMSVAEIDALLYSSQHPAESLQRALNITALSPGWRTSLQALLTAANEGKTTGNAGLAPSSSPLPAWPGFRPLKIIASTQESADVRSFLLAGENGAPLPASLPGQHIAVKLTLKPNTPPLTRNYSLSGSSGAGTYRIGVKQEPGGLGSTYLHQHLQVGNTLLASAPRGNFILAPGTSPIVLLSAGIGVTPMLAMLHACAGTPRELWWLHGARDGTHHAFAREARTLLQSLKGAHARILYSRPGASDHAGQEYDAEGHLDIPLLRQLGVPQDADFYLCGPAGFLNGLMAALKLWGVAESRIHAEIFGPTPQIIAGTPQPPPHAPEGPTGTGPIVTFARSGLSVPWNTRFPNLLELAEACDVPVRWSCRTGVCHNCECAIIEGSLAYSPDPLDPPPEGRALICCSTPLAEILLDL
jgi:ferredoxin-NADP reductase/MOSC domain-containing protein YiiM